MIPNVNPELDIPPLVFYFHTGRIGLRFVREKREKQLPDAFQLLCGAFDLADGTIEWFMQSAYLRDGKATWGSSRVSACIVWAQNMGSRHTGFDGG
jgi:hypothetical protein